jgi:hypothetical protein
MKIKPPQKRIEFERFLLNLGIRDRSPIMYPKNIDERIIKDIYPELDIYLIIKNYKNKKSYLYEYYKKYSKKKTADLLSKIKYDQKTNISEIIWTIEGDLKRLTAGDNKTILFAFIKEIKTIIPAGKCNYFPNPNDILMCRPTGSQVVEIPENFMIGAKQRASLYKRLGFGELDEDLRQYAIYDENMILHPI